MRAETSLEILGRTSISMLSASLKLYFETWESELGIKWERRDKEKYFKNGFVGGYRKAFEEISGLRWHDCPADFNILEQITLVRNQEQHPDCITTMRVRHHPKTTSKYLSLFFLDANYQQMFPRSESPWYPHPIHVPCEKLLTAIEQVELLGDWLEDRMFAAKYPWRSQD